MRAGLLALSAILASSSAAAKEKKLTYRAEAKSHWKLQLVGQTLFLQTTGQLNYCGQTVMSVEEVHRAEHMLRFEGIRSCSNVMAGLVETNDAPFALVITDTPCGKPRPGRRTTTVWFEDDPSVKGCGGPMPAVAPPAPTTIPS